jgi:hypothetical protein
LDLEALKRRAQLCDEFLHPELQVYVATPEVFGMLSAQNGGDRQVRLWLSLWLPDRCREIE